MGAIGKYQLLGNDCISKSADSAERITSQWKVTHPRLFGKQILTLMADGGLERIQNWMGREEGKDLERFERGRVNMMNTRMKFSRVEMWF